MKDKQEFTNRTCADVARELLSQPALFLEFDGIDGFTPPAQAVARYTAVRQEEETMLRVGAMRLLGASDRQIEEACHVTRRSIAPILAALEKNGRITPLKERLALACGDNAERSSILLRMLLEKVEQGLQHPGAVEEEEEDTTEDDGPVGLFEASKPKRKPRKIVTMEMAAMIKAVGTVVGITTEKTLLLTGQATEIVETKVAAGRQEFEAWWRDMVKPAQAVETRAKDCESAPDATVSSAPIDIPPASPDLATSDPTRSAPPGPDPARPTDPAPPTDPPRGEPGGGSRDVPGGGQDD